MKVKNYNRMCESGPEKRQFNVISEGFKRGIVGPERLRLDKKCNYGDFTFDPVQLIQR